MIKVERETVVARVRAGKILWRSMMAQLSAAPHAIYQRRVMSRLQNPTWRSLEMPVTAATSYKTASKM
jgi:hypothetical protein